MANRFTQFKPTEFVQTYEPFPFQEMFQLAKYKQGREDQINAALGKAAGDATLKGGYLTQPYAQEITKQRIADIDRLTEMFQNKRDVGSTIRELSKLQQEWKNNPMVAAIESDRALMSKIDTQTSQPGYGSNFLYTTQDPITGQFTKEGIKEKLARGELFTMQDYGLMENVSDLKAFSPYIDRIKPAIDDQYALVTDPETGKLSYKHKTTNEELTYDIMKNASLGLLEGFKNDDGSVNMEALRAIDPEMYKNAAWKQAALAREGRGDQFNWDMLVDDYMDIARLSFYTKGKQTITGGGSDSGGSEKPIGKEEMFGSVPISYNATTATNDPAESITDLQSAAKSLGIDPMTGMDTTIGMSIYDLVYTPPTISNTEVPLGTDVAEYKKTKREEYDKQFNEQQQKYVDAIYNVELDKLKAANPDTEVMGNKVSTMSDVQMEQMARSTAEANMMKRNKLTHALYETRLAFGNQKDKIPEIDEEGNVLNYTQKEKDFLAKYEEYNKVYQDYINIDLKMINGYTSLPEDEYRRRLSKKLELKQKAQNLKPSVLDDASLLKNYRKEGDQYVPRRFSEYYDKLNSEIEKSFKTPEFTTTATLLYNEEGGFSEKQIPFYHKLISRAAVVRVQGGMGVYFKGKQLNGFNSTGTDSHKGQVITDLFVAGGKGTDKDATADFSNGTYIPSKFYFNNVNDKWMARGNFSATDANNKPIISAEYDVDISENMAEFLTADAQSELFTRDRAIDILNSTYKGTANVAKFGGPNMETEMFGDMIAYGNPDGTFSIRGKIPIYTMDANNKPIPTGEIKDLQEVIRDRGENPLSLSKDKAAEYMGDAFKYRMMSVQQEKNKNAILGTSSLNADEENVLNYIAKNESIGGDYNSINQGSDVDPDTGKVIPIGSGLSTDENLLGTELKNLTIAEIMDHQSKNRGEPGKIHAVGKYQFIPSTFKEQIERLGLPLSTKFTPNVQDRLALSYATDIAKRAYTKGMLKSQLKNAWHGVENLSDFELNSLVDSAWRLARK